jgi:hypothetical protein
MYASIFANIGLGSKGARFLRETGLFVIETEHFRGESTTIRPPAWFVRVTGQVVLGGRFQGLWR